MTDTWQSVETKFYNRPGMTTACGSLAAPIDYADSSYIVLPLISLISVLNTSNEWLQSLQTIRPSNSMRN